MSWTYSGDPATSALDQVRFLIGDTDTTAQQLSNEEITFLLSTNSSEPWASAIQAAYGLASKYARKVTKSVDGLSISYSNVSKQYRDLAAQLRNQMGTFSSFAAPYAGGISVADKEIDEENSDRVAPSFTGGMNDFVSSSNNATGE